MKKEYEEALDTISKLFDENDDESNEAYEVLEEIAARLNEIENAAPDKAKAHLGNLWAQTRQVDIGSKSYLDNFILKAQAQGRELREMKATIKELLDIPITVSTFNGTSLLVKTMNKLNKLVGDKDE